MATTKNPHLIVSGRNISRAIWRGFRRRLVEFKWRGASSTRTVHGIWIRQVEGTLVILVAAEFARDDLSPDAGDHIDYPDAQATVRIKSVSGQHGVVWVCDCTSELPLEQPRAAPSVRLELFAADRMIRISFMDILLQSEQWVSRYRIGDSASWTRERIQGYRARTRVISNVVPFTEYEISVRRIDAQGRMSEERILDETTI